MHQMAVPSQANHFINESASNELRPITKHDEKLVCWRSD
jgi:hypothetical protein